MYSVLISLRSLGNLLLMLNWSWKSHSWVSDLVCVHTTVEYCELLTWILITSLSLNFWNSKTTSKWDMFSRMLGSRTPVSFFPHNLTPPLFLSPHQKFAILYCSFSVPQGVATSPCRIIPPLRCIIENQELNLSFWTHVKEVSNKLCLSPNNLS